MKSSGGGAERTEGSAEKVREQGTEMFAAEAMLASKAR